MKTLLIVILLVLVTSLSFGQVKSYKRGVGYGNHSASDMQTASKGISWWYNWSTEPEYAIVTTYSGYNVDFAPQAWNGSGINGVKSWVSQDDKVKYILGFNEPNFKAQAGMTPTQAAAAWPQLQAIADQYHLKLVSPAVNYCGDCVSENGTVYTNPFKWLDDFFTACVGCRVDYIALHWYGGGNSMTSYIEDARKYGKPIWVTEYANWESGVTAQGQKSYLAGTTNFLERDPDVFRYSWFIGRGSGATTYPYIDLYGGSGQMTTLGQLYLDIPVYDSTFVNVVPGKIEVEEYYRQKGVFADLTSDADGLLDVGYTDAGDWLKYKISVSESGEYQIITRYAGTATGRFDVYIDDVKKATVNTTNTGGWQTWASVVTSISLPAGEHILKLAVVNSGFNLNWLKFEKGAAGIDDNRLQKLKANVYPNPILENKFKIVFENSVTDDMTIQIIDLTGKTVYTQKVGKLNGKEIGVDLRNLPGISKGIYTLSVRTKKGYLNQKIALF
jgi:hypothetical protein